MPLPTLLPVSRIAPANEVRMKKMKLAKVFVPIIAVMTIGSIPALADQKEKFGVTMSSFGHVFHIDIMNGMKKWAEAHPNVELAMVDACGPRQRKASVLQLWTNTSFR
jgi:ABC-type sugar transport system substrate-binding protein